MGHIATPRRAAPKPSHAGIRFVGATPGRMDPVTNILLVDDDEIDVANVRRAFARGHIPSPLFHAGDGLIALEMLRARVVPQARRLVLLDLNMPRMSGIEFLREL